MKIFELHWAGHLVYLTILGSSFYWGMHKLEQTTFLKTEIRQVQELTKPAIRRTNEQYISNISRDSYAWRTPRNVEIDSTAHQALHLVNAFSEKCGIAQANLHAGTPQDNWSAEIIWDYRLLGDSLKIILPQDSFLQAWLDHCFFAEYQTCPPEQLSAWLTENKSAGVLLQNLALQAELALNRGLSSLQKRTLNGNISFDAMMPVIAYHDCARAGQPFAAGVYFVPYSTSTEGMSLQINDQPVAMTKGLAHYQTTNEQGIAHELLAKIIIQNPLTGETRAYMATLSAPGEQKASYPANR